MTAVSVFKSTTEKAIQPIKPSVAPQLYYSRLTLPSPSACRKRLLGFFAAFGNFFHLTALRAQKDLRRFAAFEPFLTLPVTAVFSLEPGFSRL